MYYIAATIMVISMVVIHETAHAIAAHLVGFKVTEIALGIPIEKQFKRFKFSTILYQHKREGKPTLTLSYLLLGGGVSYNKEYKIAPFHKQLLVFLVGPLSNFVVGLLAAVIFLGPSTGWQISLDSVAAYFKLFTTHINYLNPSNFISPVGMVVLAARTMEADFWNSLLFWWILVNHGLFVSNLLPIPALDGGRIITSAIVSIWKEKVLKPINVTVHVSLYLILALMLYFVGKDILGLILGTF